jgi:hypothetical protein
MIATEYPPVHKRSQAGQTLSSWIRQQTSKLGLLMSSPVFGLGVLLLCLAPLLLE